jgi:hypothetical protein
MACLPWTNGVSLIGVLGKRRSILSSATRPERHQVYSPAAPPRSVSTLPGKEADEFRVAGSDLSRLLPARSSRPR